MKAITNRLEAVVIILFVTFFYVLLTPILVGLDYAIRVPKLVREDRLWEGTKDFGGYLAEIYWEDLRPLYGQFFEVLRTGEFTD